MQPIREPELLDPNRILAEERDDFTIEEHRSRSRLFAQALRDSCEYAQQVWHQLDATRGYLHRCLPDDPSRPGARRSRTAPTGPDDEDGWTDWMQTYAAAHSVLAGPHGDSGFGESEAHREARSRRAHTPVTDQMPDQPLDDPMVHRVELEAAAHHRAATEPTSPPSPRKNALLMRLPLAVLVLLAVRGLRPRRCRHDL
jgi:hypothetical protein